MTVKEMLSRFYIIPGKDEDSYVIPRSEMKNFLDQHSKEQRELCWRELNKKVYMGKDYTKAKIVILNTKQPEVWIT